MKFFKTALFSLVILLMLFSCENNKVTVLSAIKDGKELEDGDTVPFILGQNYPNPFNPTTTIRFEVAVTMHLTMNVYTDDWQKVRELRNAMTPVGVYSIHFDGRDENGKALGSGEYFYTLEGNDLTLIRKMKIVK